MILCEFCQNYWLSSACLFYFSKNSKVQKRGKVNLIGRLQLSTEKAKQEENDGIVALRILRIQVRKISSVYLSCLLITNAGEFSPNWSCPWEEVRLLRYSLIVVVQGGFNRQCCFLVLAFSSFHFTWVQRGILNSLILNSQLSAVLPNFSLFWTDRKILNLLRASVKVCTTVKIFVCSILDPSRAIFISFVWYFACRKRLWRSWRWERE